MKYSLIIFLFSISPLFGQVLDGDQEAADSLNKIEYLDTADIRAFGMFRICYSSMYICDGIIDGEDSLRFLTCDSIVIRAKIKHKRDSIFEIEYSRNAKSNFNKGSFKVFTLNGNCSLAVPEYNTEYTLTSEDIRNPWNYLPASSDGREILYSYYDDGKIIFYQCLK